MIFHAFSNLQFLIYFPGDINTDDRLLRRTLHRPVRYSPLLNSQSLVIARPANRILNLIDSCGRTKQPIMLAYGLLRRH